MKKLDVDRHTGPAFILIFIVAVVGLLITYSSVELLLILLVLVLFFVTMSSPWWVAYLWNRFIASEDKYYGD
jgi:hypothetical protein